MPTTHKEHTRHMVFFAPNGLNVTPVTLNYNSSDKKIESDFQSRESYSISRVNSSGAEGRRIIRQTLTVTTNIEECDLSDLVYFAEETKKLFPFKSLRESKNKTREDDQTQYDFLTTILIDSQPRLTIRVQGRAGKEEYARIVDQYIDDIYRLFYDNYRERLKPVVVKKSRDIGWAPLYLSQPMKTLHRQLQQLTNELKALSLSSEHTKEISDRVKQILSIKDEGERNGSIRHFVNSSERLLRIVLERHLPLLLQNTELLLRAVEQMLEEHPEPPKSCCTIM